jgi:hypothetical protein
MQISKIWSKSGQNLVRFWSDFGHILVQFGQNLVQFGKRNPSGDLAQLPADHFT